MTFAVRVARKLSRAAEAKMRLPRIANRPAAIVALKIDEGFRSTASALSCHDPVAHSRGHAVTMVRQLGTDDIPAEGRIIGTPAARRTPKGKRRDEGWETFFASVVPRHVDLCSSRIPRTLFWKRH